MNFVVFFCTFIFYLLYQMNECYSKMVSVAYFNTERPVIQCYDRRYFENITMLSRRINRSDPRHYVEIYAHTLGPSNNSLSLDYYFYQFLTNRYRPSFVELHFKFCDMMNSDNIIGTPMRNAAGGRLCPYPAGIYHLKNLTILYVPKSFPFTKGRIYFNMSLTLNGVTKTILKGSIDMEVQVAKFNKN